MIYDPLTLCMSNDGQSAINKTNMNKINDGAKMNRSAENPATAHTRSRCASCEKTIAKPC